MTPADPALQAALACLSVTDNEPCLCEGENGEKYAKHPAVLASALKEAWAENSRLREIEEAARNHSCVMGTAQLKAALSQSKEAA